MFKSKISYIFPYFLVFISGMMIFVLEILWSRVIWPYIWSSLYVWTALITSILLFLSVWSIVFWSIADKYNYHTLIRILFFCIALSILWIVAIDSFLAFYIVSFSLDARISALLLSSILFAPATFLLAAVFPVVTKKCISNLETDGRVIGRISMISTYGSLLWIWLSIFVFVPYLGLDMTLIAMAIICVLISCTQWKMYIKSVIFILFCIWTVLYIHKENEFLQKKGITTIDTLYSRIHVVDDRGPLSHFRMFIIDTRILSEYNMKTKDLTPYVEEKFYIFPSFIESFQDVLMIWWAWYTFPNEFVGTFPDARIDVVEIDEKMKEVAEDYFFLKDNPNLNIIHTDARYYLNTSSQKYDVILWDAYSQLRTVPYQLATREAIQAKYDALKEDGVVVENVISSLKGETSIYLQSQYNMFSEIFDEVYIYPSHIDEKGERVQNIFLVALKWNTSKGMSAQYRHELLQNELDFSSQTDISLSDDYAPIENITAPMNKNIRKNPINTLYD